jgi:Ca-activated chloride channel family protein
MSKTYFQILGIFLGLMFVDGTGAVVAQENEPHIHVNVDLVQLNVAVTDTKGDYITGLRPQDFAITEDGIKEKLATFAEGNEPARRVVDLGPDDGKSPAPSDSAAITPGGGAPQTLGSLVAGANVFILFDTSNYMYRGFVFAQDAIADFVRSLETADKIAFYSYSRDLSRASGLTADRSQVLRGVRTTVAGDDAALYNCLLLTVKDAARYTGRKVVVVFSNGPDNTSMVPPEDVAELAQSTGIPVYMISTQLARMEPVSTAVFERMAAATGGKAYFAKNWRDEKVAFASIRNDLAHLYGLSYYPQANPNRGWRAINVRLVGEHLKKYNIRTRNGYRPQQTQAIVEIAPISSQESAPQ